MKRADLSPYEKERLKDLIDLEVLDTQAEASFDALTHLASLICKTPISLISLVDRDRQWFKSKVGLDANETPRNVAFCAHTILQDDVMVVPDSTKDERFHDNPLVTNAPFVKFYAGVPLKTARGYNIGTLCVIDHIPRNLTEEQIEMLGLLATQASYILETRKELVRLARQNQNLEDFARSISHDIKSPLTILSCFTDILEKDIQSLKGNAKILRHTSTLRTQIGSIQQLVAGIIELARATTTTTTTFQEINLSDFFHELMQGYSIVTNVSYQIDDQLKTVLCNQTELTQVFSNLVSNAVKNCDKDKCLIKFSAQDQGDMYAFSVEDNGPGIPPEHHDRLFKLFQTMDPDKAKDGSGIGLSIVKRLIEKYRGSIGIESDGKNGTKIWFTLEKPAKQNSSPEQKIG